MRGGFLLAVVVVFFVEQVDSFQGLDRGVYATLSVRGGDEESLVPKKLKKRTAAKRPKKSKRKKSPNQGRKRVQGTQEATCLRRVKREWAELIQMGIAYDWKKMKAISKSDADNNHAYVRIGPYGSNLLQWHFSVSGCPDSEYEHGIYHGRVLLPKNYPGSPPRIQLLTPSGRFIPGYDICLSASNYHPESWTPQWTILSLVDALRLHMLTHASEIGGVEAKPDERRRLAKASRKWTLGVINHHTMITQGLFVEGGVAGEIDSMDVQYPDVAPQETDEGKVRMPASNGDSIVDFRKTKADALSAQEKVPQELSIVFQILKVFMDILLRPRRLAILGILTTAIILGNRSQ